MAHLVFAAATLAAAGQLPEWGQYFAYLRAFLFGDLGELTYDFSRWSAGLAVGAGYLASAAALFLLVRRRPAMLSAARTALVAVAGTTAFGIALFSYFVNRSGDHILPYVSLPAVMLGGIWLSLLLSGALTASRPLRLAGLAAALSIVVLMGAVASSSLGEKLSRTPLAYAAPGGESLDSALDNLGHSVPVDGRAPEGERLLDSFMPGEDRVPILVSPDLETEVLLRARRANALGLAYTREDSFVPAQRLPGLERALQELRPGRRLLLQEEGLEVLAVYESDPSRDPFVDPVAPESLSELQEWAVRWIGQRFELEIVHRGEQGFVVAELAPRSAQDG